jgi:hypothetical protein
MCIICVFREPSFELSLGHSKFAFLFCSETKPSNRGLAKFTFIIPALSRTIVLHHRPGGGLSASAKLGISAISHAEDARSTRAWVIQTTYCFFFFRFKNKPSNRGLARFTLLFSRLSGGWSASAMNEVAMKKKTNVCRRRSFESSLDPNLELRLFFPQGH